MSDEQPVPVTLESIASQIRDLSGQFGQIDKRFSLIDERFAQIDERFVQIDKRFAQIDKRFAQIDRRFAQIDKRFDELKAQLRTEIEAVRGDVRLVAEAVAAQHAQNRHNEAQHKAFLKRIEGHERRIVALERKRDSA